MICEKYSNLTIEEKIRMVGILVHIIQTDDTFFDLGQMAIDKAAERGLLEGILILPPPIQPTYEQDDIINEQ